MFLIEADMSLRHYTETPKLLRNRIRHKFVRRNRYGILISEEGSRSHFLNFNRVYFELKSENQPSHLKDINKLFSTFYYCY